MRHTTSEQLVQMHGEVQEKRVLAVSFLDRCGESECLGFLCYMAGALTYLQKHRAAFKVVGPSNLHVSRGGLASFSACPLLTVRVGGHSESRRQ